MAKIIRKSKSAATIRITKSITAILVNRLLFFGIKKNQFCISEFLARLGDATVVGDGLDPATTMGPIQNAAQYHKALGYLEDARASGTIIAGGVPVPGPGYFIRPTIVRDIPDSARLVQEEQFCPVLPVLSYENLDDAIQRANAFSSRPFEAFHWSTIGQA